MTFSVIASLTTIIYPGAVAHYTFGAGWKTAIQSVFGSLWARVEAIAIGGLIMNWFAFWSLPNFPPLPPEVSPSEEATVRLITMGLVTVLYLLPLLLHAAVEAYYWLGSTSPQPEHQ